MNIQWYPGHMTKTRRQMERDLKLVDVVCEILDARIPYSSRNPDIAAICGDKPRMVILNRLDLADEQMNKKWLEHFKALGFAAIATDCKRRRGIELFAPAVKELLKEKTDRRAEKGFVGQTIKAMIVGIPNVGKSAFINAVANRKSAKAENRPGVTRGKQWIKIDQSLELLDTPGILWPKFEDQRVGRMLAFTGAVRDAVLDPEELAYYLADLLYERYPESLMERYKLPAGAYTDTYELLAQIGRRRGFLVSGGEVDMLRTSKTLIDDYRSGRLGRMTLEGPDMSME